MESDNRLPTGQWNGFYLESQKPKRGWMHLYMSFADEKIKGEGTDYVGPWVAQGQYDLTTGVCSWVKQYLGQHSVTYNGQITDKGILGEWQISFITGQFHIWPKGMTMLDEHYLAEDLAMPAPASPLGTAVTEDLEHEFASFG